MPRNPRIGEKRHRVGIMCPNCGCMKSTVTSGPVPSIDGKFIWRRRHCRRCSEPFSTHETVIRGRHAIKRPSNDSSVQKLPERGREPRSLYKRDPFR